MTRNNSWGNFIRDLEKSIAKAESQSGLFSALEIADHINKKIGGNYYPSKGLGKTYIGGNREFEIKSNKRIKNYNKAFARNLMQSYIYCFIFHIIENPFGYTLSRSTVTKEIEELSSGGSKSGDIIPVYCKAPPMLKKSGKYPDLQVPADIIDRANTPWLQTGKLADSLRFRFIRNSKSNEIKVYAGFLKPNITKSSTGRRTTAAQRATRLEYGSIGQIPRPLIRLILRSNMFQEMKRELIEIMNGKRSKGEIRADYIADKVIEGLKEFSQEEE